MKILHSLIALSFLATASTALADDHKGHDGEDMNVHNKTGHEVVVFMFDDAKIHLNETGGVQFAHIKDGESAVAHVPHCNFGILLLDHEDIWHAEFHDCHSTDMTFTKDTNHAHRGH